MSQGSSQPLDIAFSQDRLLCLECLMPIAGNSQAVEKRIFFDEILDIAAQLGCG
jgi:hypothetical protein